MIPTNGYDFIIFNLGYTYVNENDTKTKPSPQRSFGGYKIAKFLRARGFRVKCVDFLYDFSHDEFDKLLDALVGSSTLGICFSMMFGNLFVEEYENKFIEYVERAKLRGKKIIIGGKIRKTLTNSQKLKSIADYIIYNEAERVMFKIADGLRSGKIDINLKLKKEFSALEAYPNTEEEEKELALDFTEDDDLFFNEPVTIELARGCIFNCSFCTYPNRGKSKLDFVVDLDKFKEMLLVNYERFGITDYYIADSTFNDSNEKIALIADAVASLPFVPRFTGYLRPELLLRYPEQIESLVKMNFCAGFFGIETLHPQAQRAIGKKFTFEEITGLFKTLKQRMPGFHVHCSIIVGLPYETEAELDVNMRRLIECEDIDFLKLHPLILSKSNNLDFLSKFEQDQKKYGYSTVAAKVTKNTDFHWTNSTNGMDFSKAIELSDKYFHMGMTHPKRKYPVSSFYLWHEQFLKSHPDFINEYKTKVFSNLERE